MKPNALNLLIEHFVLHHKNIYQTDIMERVQLNYSMKNIPIPNKQYYLKCMIEKCVSLISRMRWKLHLAEQETDDECDFNNYGFKSEYAPRQHEALVAFENDLFEMVRSLEFRNYTNCFQNRIRKDVKDITSSEAVYVPADKTTNLYKMSKDMYRKLVKDNTTAVYKKAHENTRREVDSEAYFIAADLELADRIDKIAEANAFVTIKDHKDNFPNTIKCRLINPAKSEIGKISKYHLQLINSNIRSSSNLNQWQNTSTVLSWFKNIPNKSCCRFLQMDIVDFYPSISEKLLRKAITYANSFSPIEDEIINIIMHCRKSLLFDDGTLWTKKNSPNFDVTMGSFDGAEVCELVGLYLLHLMRDSFPDINFGLYRDDGLGITSGINSSDLERMKKGVIQLFKRNHLRITIDADLEQVDFLDVTLCLRTDKYWPYRKPNSEPLYINKLSNHPPSIIKELPKTIEKRVSDLSCNSAEFAKSKPLYEEALSRSGFAVKLNFVEPTSRRRNRPRNIIWFNPPYNAQVKTNVGKEFMGLVNKHFPQHHKYRKFFNENNVKVSYSCTKNLASIISSHNKRVLNKNQPGPFNEGGCNCRKEACPLDGNCKENCLVYKADVQEGSSTKTYFGVSEPPFKARYHNHKSSFNKKKKYQPTTLAAYIWQLKDSGKRPGIDFNICWSKHKRVPAYRRGSRRCALCLEEKHTILHADPSTTLNKKSEMLNKCLHSYKHRLISLKGDLT